MNVRSYACKCDCFIVKDAQFYYDLLNKGDKMFKKVTINVVIYALLIAIYPAFSLASADQQFNKLTNTYFNQIYFPYNPTQAVMLGLHQYDNQLEDYSKESHIQYSGKLKQIEAKIRALNAKTLSQTARDDRELILNHIQSQLLSIDKIRSWQKNPDEYSSGIANAAFVIIERPYKPLDERLQSLIIREQKMPAILAAARKNLVNPPKIYTEIALEQLPDLIKFFQTDVPAVFLQVKDTQRLKEFKQANQAVVDALLSYQQWLQVDLLPRSKGDFKLGKKVFAQKLQYDEMVDLPIATLLAVGRADLKKNQTAYDALKKELAKGESPDVWLKKFNANHPPASQLLPTFSASFAEIIQFIKQNKIITIPSSVEPIMEETPPFLRATTFASMDTPGAFETSATQAYFNVTLPSPAWTQAQQNDYLAAFNFPRIKNTTIHEVYPGHYVQFLWIQTLSDPIRKMFYSNSNVEGWAHYCEQMMLDAGFMQSGNLEQAKLMRLGQLQDALLRNARYVVAIEMHTGTMTYEQAIKFFMNEGRQSYSTAVMEAKRGTSDPLYLYYTLGKLQILKLRADLQAKLGDEFTLEKFHDDFMRVGPMPIKIVRRTMLGDDTPTL